VTIRDGRAPVEAEASRAALHWAGPEAAAPTLGEGEVHVWIVGADAPLARAHFEILSADERDRAARFRFEIDRTRFLRRRAALRVILGGYLGAPPAEVSYSENAFGKPGLGGNRADAGLSFNTSHSDALALIAVSRCRRLGIDIERLRPLVEAERIAASYFAAGEAAAFAALPAGDRVAGFYNAWTRKEAVVKALGGGLSIPLDSFEVSLRPGDRAAILECRADAELAAELELIHLECCASYVGAVACDARAATIRYGAFTP
jgi:4'-phosphopantetheinyl transferase